MNSLAINDIRKVKAALDKQADFNQLLEMGSDSTYLNRMLTEIIHYMVVLLYCRLFYQI